MAGPVIRSVAVAFAFAALPAAAQPALVGDDAQVVDAPAETRLGALLSALEADTGARFAVVSAPSLGADGIEGAARRAASAHRADVVLILAPAERQIRIEVAPALVPVLNDAFLGETTKLMVPSLTDGRFEEGLLIGAATIEARLRKAAGAAA